MASAPVCVRVYLVSRGVGDDLAPAFVDLFSLAFLRMCVRVVRVQSMAVHLVVITRRIEPNLGSVSHTLHDTCTMRSRVVSEGE